MIRWLICFLALLGLGLAAAIAPLTAQVPGYPPVNSFQTGNAGNAPPSWKSLSATQAILNLGTMAYQNAAAVAITGGTLTGIPNPINAHDVATKQYVDNTAVGFTPHAASRLATTAALPANTYANGSSGIGATLTATANAALSVDGTAVAVNDRILVKNEAATTTNGIYGVTATGSGSAPYVLTRTTDANQPGTGNANLIGFGTFTAVTAGSVNVNSGWLVNAPVTAIGTSPIVFVQFSGGTVPAVTSLNGLLGPLTIGPAVSSAGGSNIQLAGIQPQGRLTLQSGTPVMLTTQTAKTIIYYDCYHGGNLAPVYNGSVDALLPIVGCEVSTQLQNSGAAKINNADVFDVWAVNAAGALTLCVATNGSGGGWKTDTGGSLTARGTGYSQLDMTTRGYITNKNAVTNCYSGTVNEGSVAANQATYLGTFYSTAAGQTSWTFGNSGVQTTLALYNAYNRVWVWGGPSGNSSAGFTSGNTTNWGYLVQDNFVQGLSEEPVNIDSFLDTLANVGATCTLGLGLDSQTNANQVTLAQIINSMSGSGSIGSFIGNHWAVTSGVGYHYVSQLYLVQTSTSSCTFYPAGNGTGFLQISLRM